MLVDSRQQATGTGWVLNAEVEYLLLYVEGS